MKRLVWLGMVVVLLAASGAAAQTLSPRVRARYVRLFNKGNAFLYQGKFVPAVAHYRMAIRLAPRLPGAWRQLGLAYEGLTQYADAAKAYEKYLDLAGPGGRYSLKVLIRLNVCRKKLGLPPRKLDLPGAAPGFVEVTSNVPGALVMVDNIQRGATSAKPERFKVVMGAHTVTVSMAGYLPFSKTVEIYPSQVVKVEAVLKKDPNERPVRALVSRPVPQSSRKETCLRFQVNRGPIVVVAAGRGRLRPDAGGAYHLEPGQWVLTVTAPGALPWHGKVDVIEGRCRVLHVEFGLLGKKRTYGRWAWGTLAAAGALVTVGALFGFLENALSERIQDRNVSTREELDALARKERTYKAVSLGLYGAAGAAFIGSVILFAVRRHKSSSRLEGLSVTPAQHGVGLTVGYRGEVSF